MQGALASGEVYKGQGNTSTMQESSKLHQNSTSQTNIMRFSIQIIAAALLSVVAIAAPVPGKFINYHSPSELLGSH